MLPNPNKAIIEPAKIRDYLLSPDHPVGRYKAAYFRSLGYSKETWQYLEADIRRLATFDATRIEVSDYGEKFTVRGTLVAPNGKSASTITVWIVRSGEDFPRFVTAYPEN